MKQSRIQIAKADIVRHFDSSPQKVFKLSDIREILASQRAFWRLAQSTTTNHFIAFLTEHSRLKSINFPFPQRAERCYVWGHVPLLGILLAIRRNVHLSHYTAMRIHGLTEQVPTTIYLTEERTQTDFGTPKQVGLDQDNIDMAFEKPARVSNNWVPYAGKKIYLLNGTYTDHQGIVTEQIHDDDGTELSARVTNLERTLIDITVRPSYAGGVFEVAKAFELAKDRISVNKLLAMLRKLNFAYPYHQAIGYYLQRAGYKTSQLDLVRRLPIKHDFYLTHEMGVTHHVSDWRLVVPEGFELVD